MALEDELIAFLGKKIDEQYADLLDEVRADLSQNGGSEYIELLEGGGANTGEEAVRDLLWGLNSTLFDRHIREIRSIERARMRIADGDYGVCEDCGEDISLERLELKPTAERCAYCQSEHEHKPAAHYAHHVATR